MREGAHARSAAAAAERAWLLCVVCLAVLVRYSVSLGSYSGAGKPPMYGDYEAQRHWMEVTVSLPVGQWYRNGTQNDLQYWGLDYPPLTAYVSWAFGALAEQPWVGLREMVALHTSRGMETPASKLFMRSSVLLLDVAICFPALLLLARKFAWNAAPGKGAREFSGTGRLLLAAAVLVQPALIVIDHGHFQYNSTAIGLALLSFYAMTRERELLGSVLFCLALNFKQMCLYYAPAVFFYLLSRALRTQHPVQRVAQLGIVVIATFAVLWAPFCIWRDPTETCASSLLHVLSRQFPFSRGIFEDKVANVWYTVSVLVDIRRFFGVAALAKISLVCTLVALTPVAVGLLRRPPTHRQFLVALVTSALSFFLFSFQVHEKSILLASVPSLFLLGSEPYLVAMFQLFACVSMAPLIVRDGHQVSYAVLPALFMVPVLALAKHEHLCLSPTLVRWCGTRTTLLSNLKALLWMLTTLLAVIVTALHVAAVRVPPPGHLPDLYPALFSILSAALFVLCYGAFLVVGAGNETNEIDYDDPDKRRLKHKAT